MLAVVLALATSVAYGTSNYLGPVLGRRHPLGAILLLGQLAALAGTGLIVLAAGDAPPSARAVAVGALAGAGNVLGLAAFLKAAQFGSISIVAALGASGTGMPVLWGLAQGETLTALQVAGIALAVAGGVLAAQRGAHAHIAPAGIAWALGAAIGFGLLLTALPEAADEGIAWALFDARLAVVVLLLAGIVALRAPVAVPLASTPLLAVPGVLLLLGTIAYAEASQRGLLSIVAVLASLATVVTAGLAFLVEGERLSALQRSGVAVATLGVVLLAI